MFIFHYHDKFKEASASKAAEKMNIPLFFLSFQRFCLSIVPSQFNPKNFSENEEKEISDIALFLHTRYFLSSQY